MATAWKVTINSIINDGTSLYVEFQIFNGTQTTPPFIATFVSDLTVANSVTAIKAYAQQIADNSPTLDAAIGNLVGTTYTGV